MDVGLPELRMLETIRLLANVGKDPAKRSSKHPKST